MDWWVPVFAPFILSILSHLCGNVVTCLYGNVGYMCKVKENLVELRRDLNDLIAKRNDVLSIVDAEELRDRKRLNQVAEWFSEVESIETDINLLLAHASGQDASSEDGISNDASPVHQPLSTSGCWSTDNISNCFLGEKVFNKLNEVRSLSSRGNFEEVTTKAPPKVVKRDDQRTFGLQEKLKVTWESLMQDENRMLGIYGVEGVGKTTLLAQINNKFVEKEKDFDVVIWVEVSKDPDVVDGENIEVDIEMIQNTIGERLGLCDENWFKYSRSRKADEIRRVLTLQKKRFVLLLDDLWKEVSLKTIGIPSLAGENKNKVVFTTRSTNVCGSMQATEDIEVICLAENDALELLKITARCSTLNGTRLDLAKDIVRICRCLPLKIEIIGKCLSSRTTEYEWRAVLDNFRSCPTDIESFIKNAKTLMEKIPTQRNADSSMIYARRIEITHSEKPENWTWSSIQEEPNQVAIEIATLKKVYWMDIRGNSYTRKLTPETKYEVVFVVKLEDTARGWQKPVKLKLNIVSRGKDEINQEKTSYLEDYIGEEKWVDIKVGEFVAPPKDVTARISFVMCQYDDEIKKTGLVVKGVAIRAVN